jgi:hypothetical protein
MNCRSHRILLAVAALAVLGGLLGGCASKASPQAAAPVAPQSAADALQAAVPAKLTQMTPDEKASKIASSFPIQVPVPQGEVQRGEQQSGGAWVYQIVVPGTPAEVQRWYYDVYSSSEWVMQKHNATSMVLTKNRAASNLTFEAVDEARTRVTASVGVGVQILQTQ